jgi:hypothetical protein
VTRVAWVSLSLQVVLRLFLSPPAGDALPASTCRARPWECALGDVEVWARLVKLRCGHAAPVAVLCSPAQASVHCQCPVSTVHRCTRLHALRRPSNSEITSAGAVDV